MKKFKIIDYWISIGLIAGFTILNLIEHDIEYLGMGYFIVGGWQCISMLVHFMKDWFMKKWGVRSIYHIAVLIIIGLLVLGYLGFDITIYVLFALLYTAPFMAVFYTWLCWQEVHVKMKRPMAVLK